MSGLEAFLLGIVMVSTVDPNDERNLNETEAEFRAWCRFWDAALPTWNRAVRDLGWRFASSLAWNPAVGA